VADGLDPDELSVGVSVELLDELAPPKNPFKRPNTSKDKVKSELNRPHLLSISLHLPAIESSLISPYKTASCTDTRPDSDIKSDILTTMSDAPLSVRLA